MKREFYRRVVAEYENERAKEMGMCADQLIGLGPRPIFLVMHIFV